MITLLVLYLHVWVARTWVLPWWVNSVQDWRVRVARTWVLPVSITRVQLRHVYFSRDNITGLYNLLVIITALFAFE